MKAIVQDRYGPPDQLTFRTVDPPLAADEEILVRVHAASVNAYDWHVMRGDPYIARLDLGLTRPPTKIRGRDFAGRVAAVGRNVTRFVPGDEVYGDLGEANGAFAEYACVPTSQVESKPDNLTFEQAAAVPLAGNTALIGLRDLARVEAGQRILINGASGGVGTFAVQLAKAFGAHVTGVCSTRNADLVQQIGADQIIDYTRQDFTTDRGRYDVVFDLVGNRSLTELRRPLTESGTLVLSGGGTFEGGSLLGPLGMLLAWQLQRRFARQRLVRLAEIPSAANLATLRELIESGKITPIIDRTYPLADAAKAIGYLEDEHARAKVVITM